MSQSSSARETGGAPRGATASPPAPPRLLVRRAAVLGAGTMGAQIAALLASQGIPSDLLDLPSAPGAPGGRSRLAQEAKRRLLRLRPSPVSTPDALELVRPGNVAEHLERLREAHWVIEAVVERLDVKRELWARAAPHLHPNAILSTNTSGIPIASIAQALPAELQRRFLGTHFFNPPRYLRLLEVIPTPTTDPAVVAAISRFAEHVLGKGVVLAHDVPGFIANRIGCYGLLATFHAMREAGLGFDDVDAITGPAMGRPNSATFRTLDLVGLDVFVDICDSFQHTLPDPREREAFQVPPLLREMVRRGWTGEKAGRGFYQRVEGPDGSQVLVLDPERLEYRPRRRFQAPSLAAVRSIEDPAQRLRRLVAADDPAGRFAWRVLSRALAYTAQKVGEVADDVASVDRALRWGFGWELGPFEAWDALGVPETVPTVWNCPGG